MDFWNRLRSELNYQDITHKELAAKINIPKNTLETKFMRENTPDAEFLYQCSKALNLSMDYLYTGDNIPGLNDDEMEIIRLYKTLSDSDKTMVKMVLSSVSVK